MDHSIAYVMDLSKNTIVPNTIVLQNAFSEKEENIGLDESLVQNKEQNQLSGYFKHLSDVIKDYQEVVLFGPTSAKTELLNLLKKNHLFKNIKIDVKNADKMTENQQCAFVKDYFNTRG